MNEAVRFYALAQLRADWGRRLALIMLLGIVGTVAIGATAGAVRTNSAVDRFLKDQRAFDVLVFCGAPDPERSGYGCERQVRALDQIEDTTSILEIPGLPSAGGSPVEPADDSCFDGPGDVRLVVSPDGRFGSAINQHRFIAGRSVDPSAADEVVVSRDVAERAGLRVGDTLDFRLFAGAGCESGPTAWGREIALTIVGVEVSPFEVRPESGEYRSFALTTPALLASVGHVPDTRLMVAARLRDGFEVEDLREPFGRLGISMEVVDVEGQRFALAQSVNSDNLQRSVRAHVTSQWLLGATTALTGLILLGQVLNRQLRGAAAEFSALRHLGLTRLDLASVGIAHVLSIVLPAAVLATLGAHLTSAFTPLGLARIIEADQGLRVDPVVLGLGSVAMVLGLVGVSTPSLLTVMRDPVRSARLPTGRAGAVARQVGGGPVMTTGLRMAFEPLRGPTAPPLRTGFSMILSAVVLLVAATVFAGSLSHLQGSKHLIGWNWDALLYVEGDGEGEPGADARLREVVAATPGVQAATSGTIFTPVLVAFGPDEIFTPLFTFDGGPIGPTLISGRAPSGPTEIVLGRETLATLGYHEGDQIPFLATSGASDEFASGQSLRGTLRVVGTAVLPAGGGGDRLGTGGAVDAEFVRSLLPEAQSGAVFVRYEPGADPGQVNAAVADSLGAAAVGSITEETFGLDQTLRDVEGIRSLPLAFAAMLALLVLGVVGQVVVGSTHARRGELGVLRALGFRPRQIRHAIVVQTTAMVGAVLVVGIPVGIALGRATWSAFALSLGTRPEVSLAPGWLASLSLGLVVLAAALALVGSARPRAQLTAALHRE